MDNKFSAGDVVTCTSLGGFESHALFDMKCDGNFVFRSTSFRWSSGDFGIILDCSPTPAAPIVKIYTSKGYMGWAHEAWLDRI